MTDKDTADTIPTPRANPFLLGHEEAERQFALAWKSGRMPHAWLIAGSQGIGKATLAFRFARFVLAGGDEGLAADANSGVFRRVAAGSHPDLITLEPSYDEKNKRQRKEIRVDEVRAAGSTLRLTPAEGGWRVIVVDSADLLNNNSANALLKILEEPPARALLLLVSHAPGRLHATIRSRCRRLSLRPLPDATVAALLHRYVPDLGKDDSALLVRLGEGSIGRAIELAGEDGAGLYRRVLALLLALPRPDGAELHALGESFDSRRAGGDASFRAASGFLTWWLAGLVRAGATGTIPPGLPAEEVECLSRLLVSRGLDHWLGLWEKIGRLIVRCHSVNLDRKQVWVSAFLDLAAHAR